jgi:hypothetical protein
MKLSSMTLFVPLIALMTMSTAAPLSVDDSGLTELAAVNTRLISFSRASTNLTHLQQRASTSKKTTKSSHGPKSSGNSVCNEVVAAAAAFAVSASLTYVSFDILSDVSFCCSCFDRHVEHMKITVASTASQIVTRRPKPWLPGLLPPF